MLSNDDLKNIQDLITKSINTALQPVTKDMKLIKSDIKKIKKDVSVMVSSFNRADISLHKRVTRIEKHLNLSTPQ